MINKLRNLFPLIILLIIIIAFISQQPTSAIALPHKRESGWNMFIQNVSANKRMDTKSYWELREFYYQGVFSLDKNGFKNDRLNAILSEANIKVPTTISPKVFLKYNSNSFRSEESLIATDSAQLIKVINIRSHAEDVLAYGDNYVIVKSGSQKALIIFLATTNEMIQSNGFAAENKDFVKGKDWLSVSEVSL